MARKEPLPSSRQVGPPSGSDGLGADDLLPLAEEAMDHLMALVTADEAREPGVRQKTYESVRAFLRQLARAVPLPTDYAKEWKAKYPPTKKGPDNEPIRQRNMGRPDVPYTEEPLRRAFGAIVQHAATWPTLPAEDVLDYCRKEVQEALLDDIGVKLPDWAKNSSISKKTCAYLKSVARKCDDAPVQKLEPTSRTPVTENGLDAESFPAKLRTVFQRFGPEERKQRILAEIEAYASDYPNNIEKLAAELERLVELKRPPKTERTLNLRMASERSGLSVPYLSQLCLDGSLGEQIAKKPRFSEVELDEFVSQVRKPGPKPKPKPKRGGS